MSSSDRDYIFSMQRVSKSFVPGKKVLSNINLSFYWGAKIGVLGLNGAGKSTLLQVMAGQVTELEGEAVAHKDATVGYLPQEPQLDPDKDVLGNIREGLGEVVKLLDRYDELNEKLGEDLSPDAMDAVLVEHTKVQDAIEAAGGWEVEHRIEMAMEALRCPPGDANVTTLSGGERRRVALARLLLQKPDLLLLDEPTNHLDAAAVAWLEHHLHEYPGTVVAVTHDRYFLDNVAGWILELDRGRGIPWQGNYSSWLEQKQKRLSQEEKQESNRQRTLKRELEWVRMSPKARQAKGKARLNAYESLLAEGNLVRQDKVEDLHIPNGPRLGDLVIEAASLRKGYGELLLIEDLNFKLPPAGIVGIIGANGAGKTTLFRMLADQIKPDSGSLKVGSTVDLAYVDQSRDTLVADKTIYEEISGGHDFITLGGREVNSRAYVGRFNFKGQDQQKLVGKLSGGERNRVHLAKLLRRGGNVLLLDEPTNDLDIDTLRALEDALLQFAGCALVISHDRWFLDRIATHILAFEGDSQVVWFQGNYQDYEEDRRRRHGDSAEVPTRIKYKKLA